MAVSVLLILSIVEIPFVLAFSTSTPLAFELFIDAVFGCDIFVNFNTAVFDKKSDQMITRRRDIATRYLSFWFWVDLISTIPFDLIFAAQFAKTTRILRILRILRLLKLVRLLKLMKLFKSDSSVKSNSALLSAQFLIVKILFVCHWVACIWVYIGYQGIAGLSHSADGPISSQDNSNNTDSSWLVHFSYDTKPIYSQYIAAYYWTVTTLLSVGYGDIVPVTTSEMMFTIATQIFGGVIFGAIIAQVSDILANKDPISKAFTERMNELNSYLDERKLPAALKKKAKVTEGHYIIHTE